jgi:hypothetical protein
MKEDFLHFLWRFQLWKTLLYSDDGQWIEVISQGFYNHNAGPDFLNCRIRVGSMLLIGNIEIHVKSSDWFLHKHQDDAAYNNVILHVVYDLDVLATNSKGGQMLHCCIKNNFSDNCFKKFEKWKNDKDFIACQENLSSIREITKQNLLEKTCIESLERRINEIQTDLSLHQNSWEEVFYWHLLRSFGLKINAEAFYYVAKSTPLKLLQKHSNSIFQLEAMLLGQATLLNRNFKDPYPTALKEEYAFLRFKYKLLPINKNFINFLRLRPQSFPTIRLILFAQFISNHKNLFTIITEPQSVKTMRDFFKVNSFDYWDNHYVFDKTSHTLKKTLGAMATDLIIINTIIPFMMAFGRLRGRQDLFDKAIEILQMLPPENNNEIRNWQKYGIVVENAMQSQALLFLKKHYCDFQRCLSCSIGYEIFKGDFKD